MTANYLCRTPFLGRHRRLQLVETLDGSPARWDRSAALGRTGRGDVRQLVPTASEYLGRELTALRQVMASLCYDTTASTFQLPGPDRVVPQVFPVLMRGSATDPPFQAIHVDNRGGVPPLVTAVYYARVDGVDGGEIVLGADGDGVIIEPSEDALLAFAGDTPHAVRELRAGHRVSIVCNFFAA